MRTASWDQRSQNLRIKAALVRARETLGYVKRGLNVEWVERLVNHARLQIMLATSFVESDPRRARQHLKSAEKILGFTKAFKGHHNPIFSAGRSQAALNVTRALKSQLGKAGFVIERTAAELGQKKPQFCEVVSIGLHPLSVRPQISPNAPAL